MNTITLNARQLKWIALITMTIDHVGAFILPQYKIFRIIGRIAFPIYAFLISEGYVHTSSKLHYFIRMLGFAILTQVLFVVFHVPFINVLFTFAIGIASLYCIDRQWHVWNLVLIVLTAMINPDYSFYGVIMILLFYLYRTSKMKQMVSMCILTFLYTFQSVLFNAETLMMVVKNIGHYWTFFLQIFSMFSIPILVCYDGSMGKCKTASPVVKFCSKYFFYLYYPVHIILFVWYKGVM